jgi:hypothetical protein
MKVYIAGPITGMPEYNWEAFHWAEGKFPDSVNPLTWYLSPNAKFYKTVAVDEINAEYGITKSHGDYLREALSLLLTCSAIYLLPGWSKSAGASLEYRVAVACGMAVFYAPGAEEQ